MANARQQKQPKALIHRTLESARREIEQIERKFHHAIRAVQNGGFTSGRVLQRQRRLEPGPPLVAQWAVPHRFRRAISNVLKKRRTGLTMSSPNGSAEFDEKSLPTTFAMRRKGLITFDKTGKGRGKYRWEASDPSAHTMLTVAL